MGLLSFLFGCGGPQDSPFQQKGGAWYYESTPIGGADAKTFEPLSRRYARDRHRVYYGETYRDGRDYFTTKRSRVSVVEGAEPSTFRYVEREYARDRTSMFFEGARFAVRDVESFELLDYGYSRDRLSGYYHQRPVPGSDGGTFAALSTHYSKDKAQVFHSELEPGSGGGPPVRRSTVLKGAQPESFSVLDGGYAADAGQAYFEGQLLTRAAASFRVLAFGYAKTATQVYYSGKPVPGADAASFATMDQRTDTADARDRGHTYQQGRRIAAIAPG